MINAKIKGSFADHEYQLPWWELLVYGLPFFQAFWLSFQKTAAKILKQTDDP